MNNDIIGDTVEKKKLSKIKNKLKSLRLHPNNVRSKELQNIARSLGRKIAKRGHEPNYISELLPKNRPISIPDHPGALARFTAENILDQLEQDIFDLEELIKRPQI